MALTATIIKHSSKPYLSVSRTTANLGTYATGGVTVTPTQLGLSSVDHAIVQLYSSAGSVSNATRFSYNVATSKVQAWSNSNVEVSNATSLSNLTLRITGFGV